MNVRLPLRRGFALPVALLAIMVMGALVTGGFYMASGATRVGIHAELGSRAFYVAEYGLNEALGTWRNRDLTAAGEAAILDPEPVVEDGQVLGRYALSVRRLGPSLFLISSEGRVPAGRDDAVRQVGAVVRTTSGALQRPAALAIAGRLDIGEGARVSGRDAGGPDCRPGDSAAAVLSFDTPEAATRSTLGAGGLDRLAAAATHVFDEDAVARAVAPAVTVHEDGATVCDRSRLDNWGEPGDVGHACAEHFPVIHARRGLRLEGGRGQGILIVDGDLELRDGAEFYGLVLVGGTLRTVGTGNRIEGAVIVQGGEDPDAGSSLGGDARIRYSRCRVDRALDAGLRPRLLGPRSWIDVSAARGAAPRAGGES